MATLLASLYVVANFMLAFPAISVDDRGSAISTAWFRARQNRLRLCFGLFVAILRYLIPTLVIIGALLLHAAHLHGAGTAITPIRLHPAVSVGLGVLAFFIYATGDVFASLAYRQLAQDQNMPSTPARVQFET